MISGLWVSQEQEKYLIQRFIPRIQHNKKHTREHPSNRCSYYRKGSICLTTAEQNLKGSELKGV